MEEQNKDQEYAFIKEKIKDKPINRRRLLARLAWVASSAVIFGFLACLVFVIMKPRLEEWIYPQEDPTITFPKDPELVEDETEQEPEKDAEATEQETEPIYVEKELELADFQTLQNKLYTIGKKANKSVVTVTAVNSSVDWFNSPYENEPASGIIIAENQQELYILTEKKVIADAENIHITFINDDIVPASLKNYDGNTGIAIISVNLSDISEETLGKIEVAVLGNSLPVNQGTVVIAVGSPLGTNYAILDGTITASGNTVSTLDSTYTIFTTDIPGNANGRGALINLSGEVVGLIMQGFGSSGGGQNIITALSISELKGIIQDLSSGKDIPYLGLKVSTINDETAEKFSVPKGVYIKWVELDSPAWGAALQEADVIVEMNGEEIMTVEQYTQKLFELKPEQEVRIKTLRQSGEDYVEQECTAVVGVLR